MPKVPTMVESFVVVPASEWKAKERSIGIPNPGSWGFAEVPPAK